MSPLFMPIAVPSLVIVFLVNAMGLAPFGDLCRRIAEREGRQREFNAPAMEGGSTYFEIEQHWRLWRRDYLRYADPGLNALGDRAFRWNAFTSMFNLVCVFILIFALAA